MERRRCEPLWKSRRVARAAAPVLQAHASTHTQAQAILWGVFLESVPLVIYNILCLIHFPCFNSYRIVLAGAAVVAYRMNSTLLTMPPPAEVDFVTNGSANPHSVHMLVNEQLVWHAVLNE